MSSKKRFIKLPEYPGGKEEFQKYIRENLKYPQEALQNKIEGFVHLTAVIDDNGNVSEAAITKHLGYGCDEEALRLINGLKFGGVKNKGVRVKQQRKFRILFKIDNSKTVAGNNSEIRYHYKPDDKPANNNQPDSHKNAQRYSYTINLR